jgi:ATP-dependent Clp protease adaptor protein ClpS
MQTADYWQLLFSDRFTGARNPARLLTTDAIPSNPLRPLSLSFYHLMTGSLETTRMTPTTTPETGQREGEKLTPLYHVVLLDDDQHTYDYVVEMLGALFIMPLEVAYNHAVEVDTTGRTIVITCERPQAEFARDQIHGYGADPRMAISKGPMRAVIQPVYAGPG